ncbi:MAG: FlgD immunoglobulin-like domain containing protein, partial [Nitrososphaera sp.]
RQKFICLQIIYIWRFIMKSLQIWLALTCMVVWAGGELSSGSSTLMAQGVVTAEAKPSQSNPNRDAQITVDINIDGSRISPPDSVGSFTGSLRWKPAILSYVSHSGVKGNFLGLVRTTNTSTGTLGFNGVNPAGVGGKSNVLTVTFKVVGAKDSSTVLDLAFSAMATGSPAFTNLLPILTVTDGTITVADPTSVRERAAPPQGFRLEQNFPNPFNPETTIPFTVPAAWKAPITLRIYDLHGRLVKTLLEGKIMPSGVHHAVWDGKDSSGEPATSGLYFYQLTSGKLVATRKMVLAR